MSKRQMTMQRLKMTELSSSRPHQRMDAPTTEGDRLDAPRRSLAPVVRGQRVFTAGHSFHVFVAHILPDLARSAGIVGHVNMGAQFLGGSRTIEHWQRLDSANEAKRALRTGLVDVLTLSPTFHPDEGIDRFTRLALDHNPNVRVTVQASWVPLDGLIYGALHPGRTGRDALSGNDLQELHAAYFQSLNEDVASLNQSYGKLVLSVVPVSQALIALRERIKAGQAATLHCQEELFIDVMGHPSLPVQLLAAYGHFAVIYRRSPVGLPVPAILAKAAKSAWGAELNSLLQEVAWSAVLEHPLSGIAEGHAGVA